ncbi:hypothetical protein [Wolbachia endosymbiont of Tettigetta isshikii]
MTGSQCRSTGMTLANYLLIAMFIQLCVKHWNDKKKGDSGMTGGGLLS